MNYFNMGYRSPDSLPEPDPESFSDSDDVDPLDPDGLPESVEYNSI